MYSIMQYLQTSEQFGQELTKETKYLPCKKIKVNDILYLERYYVTTRSDGTQLCLHHFLKPDPEQHLHTHPWDAVSTIINAGYFEDYLDEDGETVRKFYGRGQQNVIFPDKAHRITAVLPHTWSAIAIAPKRLENWHFIEPDGTRKEIKASDRNWWRNCDTRDGGKPDLAAFTMLDLFGGQDG